MTDFGAALSDLNELEIRYVLIGGIAVIRHGVVRATRDLDAVIAQDDEDIERVRHLVDRWEATRPDGSPLPDGWVRAGRVLNLLGPHGSIDLVPDRPPSLAYERLRERADVRRVDGVPAPVASLPDLVALKRIGGRPQDQADLVALEQAHGSLPELPGE